MTQENLTVLDDDDENRYTEPSPIIFKLRREKCQHLRDCVDDLLTTDSLREWTTDAQIVRFLKATGWDLSKSTHRLRDTLQWRAKLGDKKTCSLCERNPHAHNLYQCGFDKAGSPVIYSSFERANERGNADGNVEHLIMTLDRLLKVMAVDAPGYLWICDFQGFGLSDCNLGMVMQCVEIFGRHYPETLAAIYVVGAPRLWDLFWPTLNAAVRMSFSSVAKVHFVKAPDGCGAGDPFRQTLSKLVDEELLLWIVEEMTENREAALAERKAGWLEAVRLDNGVTRSGSKHDLRGPLSFRRSPSAQVCWGLSSSLAEVAAAQPAQQLSARPPGTSGSHSAGNGLVEAQLVPTPESVRDAARASAVDTASTEGTHTAAAPAAASEGGEAAGGDGDDGGRSRIEDSEAATLPLQPPPAAATVSVSS